MTKLYICDNLQLCVLGLGLEMGTEDMGLGNAGDDGVVCRYDTCKTTKAFGSIYELKHDWPFYFILE